MINVLVTIWALIGVIVGGVILLTMGIFAIGLFIAFIAAIIDGVRGK